MGLVERDVKKIHKTIWEPGLYRRTEREKRKYKRVG